MQNDVTKQWFKKFEFKEDAFEISFNPIALQVEIKTIIKGKTNIRVKRCDHIVGGIWTYNEELENFKKAHPEMEYCFPENINIEATEALLKYFNRFRDDYDASNDKEEIKYALALGADANLAPNYIGRAIFDILPANVDILELFIAYGASVDVIEQRLTWYYYPGCTPLHKAILNNYNKQAVFLKNNTKNLNFHFNIAVQHSIDSINSMANNGITWKNIYKDYRKKWGLVINKLLEWNIPPSENYIELENLLNLGTTFCEQRIQELKNTAASNWEEILKETINIFSIPQLNILIKEILFLPEAIQHPNLYSIVKAIIGKQPSFEDIAEEVYGKRVSLTDDEGWLCQGWYNGSYSNFTMLMKLLQQPNAINHNDWYKISKQIIEICDDYDCDKGDIQKFLNKKLVKAHSKRKELVKLFAVYEYE
jgi:hypothetical protein